MNDVVKNLSSRIEELSARLVSQEQKLALLEQELANKAETLGPVDDYQVVDPYREPILQRATTRQVFKKPVRSTWRSTIKRIVVYGAYSVGAALFSYLTIT